MLLKRFACAPAALLATGCAFVGPIADRGFHDAPYSACAELTDGNAPAASVGQQPVKVGCFDIVARTKSGYGAPAKAEQTFSPAGLVVTDNTSFALNASDGCKGVFTNFIVEYTAPQGGEADLLATNMLGTAIGMEEIDVEKPSPEVRRTVMRKMGDPVKDPAVLEFSDVEGELVIRSVCLKGY
jgi:hypothetical protein